MKNLFFIILLLCPACAGTAKKTSGQGDLNRISRGRSSYYYYLVSHIKQDHLEYSQSEEFLNRALKKDPESGFLWAQKALFEARKANWNNAIEFIEKALEKIPDDVDYLLLAGQLYAAKDDAGQALKFYQKAISLDPSRPEIYTVMAREYLSRKEHGQAVHMLQTCINKLSETTGCLFYLASIHLSLKNYNQALKYFTLAQQLNPDDQKLLQTISEIHLQKKDYKNAIRAFEQLKQLNPADVSHFIRLGLIYYEQKNLDRAIEEFQAVHERFPQSDRVNYFLGLFHLEKSDAETAYRHFDKIREESKFFKDSLNRMISIRREKGDLTGAVELLDAKTSKKERASEYYRLKVFLLLAKGDHKKAHSEVQRALAKYPDNEDLLFQKGIVLEKMGEWEDAKEVFLKIIAHNPKSDRAFNYVGYTMLERDENPREALSYITQALKISPRDGHIVDSMGWAYFKMGEISKAVSHLVTANALQPDEPTILEHLGDVYFKMKNKRKARFYYQQAIQLLKKLKTRTADEEGQLRNIQEKLGAF